MSYKRLLTRCKPWPELRLNRHQLPALCPGQLKDGLGGEESSPRRVRGLTSSRGTLTHGLGCEESSLRRVRGLTSSRETLTRPMSHSTSLCVTTAPSRRQVSFVIIVAINGAVRFKQPGRKSCNCTPHHALVGL